MHLIADAPLLLEAYKRLREQNKLMVDYFRYMRDGGFTDADWRTVNEWILDSTQPWYSGWSEGDEEEMIPADKWYEDGRCPKCNLTWNIDAHWEDDWGYCPNCHVKLIERGEEE